MQNDTEIDIVFGLRTLVLQRTHALCERADDPPSLMICSLALRACRDTLQLADQAMDSYQHHRPNH